MVRRKDEQSVQSEARRYATVVSMHTAIEGRIEREDSVRLRGPYVKTFKWRNLSLRRPKAKESTYGVL